MQTIAMPQSLFFWGPFHLNFPSCPRFVPFSVNKSVALNSSFAAYASPDPTCPQNWSASGGKSGAAFEKTDDDRFVIKHVKEDEFDMFVDNGAKFFQHMFRVLFEAQPSVLVKYIGAYKVEMHDQVTVTDS